ncbi:hypothetical protein FJZ40_05340, partial [Candidatus Shapirobacteria bacterium]|nr:hypothetical protein [Candidatus Shapirobacteria bacterium]
MLYDELYKEISETLVYKPTNGFYRINCNRQPEENYKADPYLVFTDSPLLSELGRVVNLMDCPLIICDSFNFPTISKLYPAQTKLIEDNFQETVKEILLLKNKNKSNSLIGLGGCTALDVAREVAGGSNLVFFPTILSTKCLTVNLSILRDKDHNEYNSVTRPPNLTVISFPYFEKLDPDLSRFWAVSC